MNQLTVTTIQTHLRWEDSAANLQIITRQLEQQNASTDLILLPEMFTTGFSMNARPIAEKMDGRSMQWMREQANRYHAVIVGSLIIEEAGKYYNRLIWMRPDGSFEKYDKRHLFTLAREHETYQAGTEKLIVELNGWKICPMICYDLRFPVWARNQEGYDLLIYVANWPDKRSLHWKALLRARAIENQSYTIGLNRVGVDEKGLNYQGDSSLYDYSGQLIYQMTNHAQVITTSLDLNAQQQYRSKLNFLPDQDRFSIEM